MKMFNEHKVGRFFEFLMIALVIFNLALMGFSKETVDEDEISASTIDHKECDSTCNDPVYLEIIDNE